MTCVSLSCSGTPPRLSALSALAWAVLGFFRRFPTGDILLAVLLVLPAAAIVHADEHLQDWVPVEITMPEDAEVVTERSIGSTVRMLSITTDADVDALFAEWEESLEANGYQVVGVDESLERAIEFSGHGIANAKIILAPTTEDGRNLIEFDATLE